MDYNISVIKRNGKSEPLMLEKIDIVLEWAVEGISNVSISEIQINSHIQFYDKIKTETIQRIMIKSAADLISEKTPNYQYVAARLLMFNLRKEVSNSFIPNLYEIVTRNVKNGFYDPVLLEEYDEEDYEIMESFINHERDFDLAYAGAMQLIGKYLVQDRVTETIFETPQIAFMLIAATVFSKYSLKERMKYIKELYNALSTFEVSLPTPIMAGVRTPQKQYSSCVLIECGDSLDSINATTSSIVKYVSQKAGIGIGASAIRTLGSPVRKGDAYHTGVTPFYRLFQSAVNSCSQGGVRKGSATLYVQLWSLEIEDILVLKNNRGSEDNRVRHMDYGIQLNKLMYERLVRGENITLFSPSDVPNLLEAFYSDSDKFAELYTQYEATNSIRKKVLKASELFGILATERMETGRIYIQNVDHANMRGPFNSKKAPIKQSNLCCVTGDTAVDVIVDGELTMGIPISYIAAICDESEVLIKSYNLEDEEIEFNKVEAAAMTRENAELVQVTDSLESISLFCTPDHLIYTENRGYVQAEELSYDDIVFFCEEQSVLSFSPVVKKLDEIEDVYDVQVANTNNFFANEILVHNCEIDLPTKPLNNVNDAEGEIALCTLAAINIGKMKSLSEIEKRANILVRTLDEILDYQEYPVPAAKTSTQKYRPLGIGITNYAYYLAKNDVKYSDGSALQLTHELFETFQYYLTKASVELAKEKDRCEGFDNLVYSDGIIPCIDLYKPDVDNLCDYKLQHEWESLRDDIRKYGIRNATISAQMPVETSSQTTNSTNGIEPPRSLISIKQSKHGILKQVVPEIVRLKNKYECAWDMPDIKGYLNLCGIMQRYIDQGISTNTYYNPQNFPEERIPMSLIIQDLLLAYKLGIKQLYYHNTYDGKSDDDGSSKQSDCDSGACKI